MESTPTSTGPSRSVLVTGGSRGIGAAVARGAAAAGWDVAVHAGRDLDAAAAVADAVRTAGRRALVLQGDVADEAAVLALFERLDAAVAAGTLAPLAGLVASAGIVDRAARLEDMPVARWQRLFAVNVIGTMTCAREALRRISRRHGGPGGALVLLGSAASRLGSPGQYVDYAASKGAIDALTLGLAREVAPDGVRVNCVRPGIIDTEIHASGGEPDRAARLGATVPLQRAGGADEVAAAVLWLLSDASSYTTGALLDVAGGR